MPRALLCHPPSALSANPSALPFPVGHLVSDGAGAEQRVGRALQWEVVGAQARPRCSRTQADPGGPSGPSRSSQSSPSCHNSKSLSGPLIKLKCLYRGQGALEGKGGG